MTRLVGCLNVLSGGMHGMPKELAAPAKDHGTEQHGQFLITSVMRPSSVQCEAVSAAALSLPLAFMLGGKSVLHDMYSSTVLVSVHKCWWHTCSVIPVTTNAWLAGVCLCKHSWEALQCSWCQDGCGSRLHSRVQIDIAFLNIVCLFQVCCKYIR